jgi:hypothetical protein
LTMGLPEFSKSGALQNAASKKCELNQFIFEAT